jgi:hypothetical protein
MAASRTADIIKNKFKSGVFPPLPLFPLRCVEGINLSFWTAGGRGEGKTPLSNLFLYEVSVAAGGHVVFNSTHY